MILKSAPSDSHSPQPTKKGVKKTGGTGAVQVADTAQSLGLSLGAPTGRPTGGHYLTKGGVQITTDVQPLEFSLDKNAKTGSAFAIEELITKLDNRRGVLLQSSYEFPGRYSRWSLGFVDPPLSITGRGRTCTVQALNARGLVILQGVRSAIEKLRLQGDVVSVGEERGENDWQGEGAEANTLHCEVAGTPPPGSFSEEDRSRLPSLFSIVRAIREEFGYQSSDGQLGLYGSFGYDLTFQFEPIEFKRDRDEEQRDLVLFLPDQVTVVDQDKRDAWTINYDFSINDKSTSGLPRGGTEIPFQEHDGSAFERRDTPEGKFADAVDKAKREFAVGNLFEAVISQTFRER